ncbi:MAG: ABC transporter permease [Candidatus Bathyarchaeota archaeon]|nr:ABC transporter permease [Candidatus Bathyarchaeota archaeon]
MNSGAGFPVNDLFRRRFQTGLAITTLTLSVSSTLFLLFFISRLGLGGSFSAKTLTLGLNSIFSQFNFFLGGLIFLVGIVLTSFIVFLMMTQRTRDFGLIKAAGCPNSLVAGYFMTELLTLSFIGCSLGLFFGFIFDYATSIFIFSEYQLVNWWLAPVIFIVFLVLAIFFGLQPIFKVSKMSAAAALSQAKYFGLSDEFSFKSSRIKLGWRIAVRSLFRRKTATIRIILFLSVVFALLTVSVTGGIVAKDTTNDWLGNSVSDGIVAVADSNFGRQYELLLSKFNSGKEVEDFNYTDPELGVKSDVIDAICLMTFVESVDPRLIVYGHVKEIANFTVAEDSMQILPVGDHREGDCLVIGVDPQNIDNVGAMKGRFLSSNDSLTAVIGDSVSQSMYSPSPSRYVVLSDPLVQSIQFNNTNFQIVGLCVDPLNNGFVTYVPLEKMMATTGLDRPNIVFIKIAGSYPVDRAVEELKNIVQNVDSSLDVFDFREIVKQNSDFLSSIWSIILFLPVFSLISASLCLVGYLMLSIEEQRHEFGALRAIGAKPRVIFSISVIQSASVIFSGFAVGTSLGVIIALMILIADPVVTSSSIAIIICWILSGLIGIFLLSLYPSFKLAKTSILKLLS